MIAMNLRLCLGIREHSEELTVRAQLKIAQTDWEIIRVEIPIIMNYGSSSIVQKTCSPE